MKRILTALGAVAVLTMLPTAPASAAPHGHAYGWVRHHGTATVSTTTTAPAPPSCFFAVSGNCLIWR